MLVTVYDTSRALIVTAKSMAQVLRPDQNGMRMCR